MNNVPGQDVEFELFDKDLDKDDFLGRWVLGGHGGGRGGLWGGPFPPHLTTTPPQVQGAAAAGAEQPHRG